MGLWKWMGITVIHLKGINTIIGSADSFIEFIHSKKQGYGIGFCISGYNLEFKISYLNMNKWKE